MLQELFFTLFRDSWMNPSIVRDALLAWNDPYMDKKRKKFRKPNPFIFLDNTEGKKQNYIVR